MPDLAALARQGQHVQVLQSPAAAALYTRLEAFLSPTSGTDADAVESLPPSSTVSRSDIVAVATSALQAFLQATVTGPVLAFTAPWTPTASADDHHRRLLAYLVVDGVSPYALIPHLDLFCLAHYLFTRVLDTVSSSSSSSSSSRVDSTLMWQKLRVMVWHHRLFVAPHLGARSVYTRSHWTDVPSLVDQINQVIRVVEQSLDGATDSQTLTPTTVSNDDCALGWLELANIHCILGHEDKARHAVTQAAACRRFQYALSGALGKRTRFQQKSTSQLVVYAVSADRLTSTKDNHQSQKPSDESHVPQAIPLEDDTLLESIDFSDHKADNTQTGLVDSKKEQDPQTDPLVDPKEDLPLALRHLTPDQQPALTSIDQMILLAEATLKDAFSIADELTLEEVLPFAQRVLNEQESPDAGKHDSGVNPKHRVNWQIYTQALLIRSRIEMHRSRTVERGVLQMQAVVDQVIADTTSTTVTDTEKESVEGQNEERKVVAPVIAVNDAPVSGKVASFFPAPKPEESAPASERLQYLHTLLTPPRWHLEAELAHAWAGVGSLVSALEIFQRLRLWAEVALCYASTAVAQEQEDHGRGSSSADAKARAILRWRLFTPTDAGQTEDVPLNSVPKDLDRMRPDEWRGPERDLLPTDAPRLYCILGDMEREPKYYERAWDLSNHRMARAQRSLGEYYLIDKRDVQAALEAYRLATSVNRLQPDLWSRRGDLALRLARWPEAASSFRRALAAANDAVGGDDARTWSNLGSALYQIYLEAEDAVDGHEEEEDEFCVDEEEKTHVDDGDETPVEGEGPSEASKEVKIGRKRNKLIVQALHAFNRGAKLSRENWRIWDNVLTLAYRVDPPAVGDMILALQNIIRLRQTEEAVDADMLAFLLQTLTKKKVVTAEGAAVVDEDETEGKTDDNRDDAKAVNASPDDVIVLKEDGELPRGSVERRIVQLVEEAVVPLITKRSVLWTLVARERLWRGDYASAMDAAEGAWRASWTISNTLPTTASLAPSPRTPAAAASTSSDGDWLRDVNGWRTVVQRTQELVTMLRVYGPRIEAIGPLKWKGRARNAVRSVQSKARGTWDSSAEWALLDDLLQSCAAR